MAAPTISDYFVCVGAQKASTSWFLQALGRHPEIFTTPVKEIHYFDHVRGLTAHLDARRRRSRFRKYLQRLATDLPRFSAYRAQWAWYRAYRQDPIDDAWYARLFEHRSGRLMAGEATPEYAILGEEGFRHIKRLAPDTLVLFVMRNPVTQAWSQFLHFEHKRDVRGVQGGLAGAVQFWESDYSARFRDYGGTIDGLLRVFGDTRTKFLFYEDMHADRAGALASVAEFLGARREPAWLNDLGQATNISSPRGVPAELRAYLVDRLRPVVREVEERLGRVPRSWRDSL